MSVEFRDDEAGFSEIGDHDLIDRARKTLCSVASGDTEDYRELLSAMNREKLGIEEVAMLVTNLNALSGSVTYIENVQDDKLLSAAISSGKYVDRCLEMLTHQFCPPDSLLLSKILARKDQVYLVCIQL